MLWQSNFGRLRLVFFQKHPRALFVSLLVVAALVLLFYDLTGPAFSRSVDLAVDFAVFAILIPLVVYSSVAQAARARRASAAACEVTVAEDRRALARDLHDSIAQHLCYLHLKLDELVEEHGRMLAPALSGQLKQMRQVANEAYEDVYCLLSGLRLNSSGNLTDTLRARATLARERAGFDIRVVETGEPHRLQSCYEPEIALVVREALTNVERHARASLVDIAVNWRLSTLDITVKDDGEGFDALDGRAGHFGLDIMKERAAEMGGQLCVRSHPGQGTLVELSLPLASIADSAVEPCT